MKGFVEVPVTPPILMHVPFTARHPPVRLIPLEKVEVAVLAPVTFKYVPEIPPNVEVPTVLVMVIGCWKVAKPFELKAKAEMEEVPVYVEVAKKRLLLMERRVHA
jgi:hypothetical protein